MPIWNENAIQERINSWTPIKSGTDKKNILIVTK